MRTAYAVLVAVVFLACVVAIAAIGMGPQIRAATLNAAQEQTLKFLRQDAVGQVGAVPPSKDLEAAARKALKCFEIQDFDSLFNQLPSWKRESYGLAQARAKAEVEADPKSERADFGKRFKDRDPGNTLKLKDKASFMNLSRAKFFALHTGLLTIHANANVLSAVRGEWFLVKVEIGILASPTPSGPFIMLQNAATARFENVEGYTLGLRFVVVDNQWVLSDWTAKIREFESTSEAEQPNQYSNEAKSSEARAALGTIKDRLRTKFIQNDNEVNTDWTLDDLVNVSELTGKYYHANDYCLISLAASTATFRANANTVTSSPQVTMSITNIQTGASTLTSP